MKHLSLYYFMLGLSMTTLAQEVRSDSAYYLDPEDRVHTTLNQVNRHVIRAQRATTTRKLFLRFSDVHNWYIRTEGGFRNNRSLLNNSLDGLVSTSNPTKTTWGVLMGYSYQHTWALETGYAHAPIQLNVRIANASDPLEFTYLNSGYGFPIRVKRRLGSGRQSTNGGGVWLTGGGWLVPNGTGPAGSFYLIGYSAYGRNRVDTLRLNNVTTVPNRITVVGELGLDAAIRLSSSLYLDGSIRTYWGLANALQSTLTYTVNNRSPKQATITTDGSGWEVGLSIRYIYGRQYELKKP